MSTRPCRVQVSLPRDVYETLSELAEIRGTSRSEIIADLVCSMHPSHKRQVSMILGVATLDARSKHELRAGYDLADKEAARIILGCLRDFSTKILEGPTGPSADSLATLVATAFAEAAEEPPSSNTGAKCGA